MEAELSAALAQRQAEGLYRSRLTLAGGAGVRRRLGAGEVLDFCSNDYLGLASDPRLVEALQAGAARWGAGAGASHLLGGHTAAHEQAEAALAAWTGRPRALLFSTGFMANLGIAAALAGPRRPVFEDRLNHASLLDAAFAARARLRRYRHADAGHLAHLLDRHGGPALVMTDAVFSMDGDRAPLRELATVCAGRDAWLMADDAHGIGVLGAQGAGSVAAAGLDSDALPVLMGTLGKALGVFGAFVAGSAALIETLVQHARSYIYTTALPPALACAVTQAVGIARAEDWRRERLQALVARFRAGAAGLGLPLADSATPIQPLLAGSSARALAWSEQLRAAGILVPAVRPPTVPAGQARLRITLSAAHGDDDLQRLLDALACLPRDEPAGCTP